MFCGKYVNRVATHPKHTAGKFHVVAFVLHANQLHDGVALVQLVTLAQRHDHLVIRLGLTNTVNGRHRGHNHHIAPLQNTFGA